MTEIGVIGHADYQVALMFDGVHPNPAGDAVMGHAWYDAIEGRLQVH